MLLDLPPDERSAWIEEHSDVDSRLRQRLMAMLAGDKLADLRTGGAGDMIDDERLPDRIGAYRITGLIGQGGMGAVYRGERMTGDFDHVAAIKVIRPGALSAALVERFQRERQTLASLSHPNIARLFDGGATEQDDPYIVMEYVDGVPLGAWIETQRASKAARIALFLDICSAVGFAHQNLIVHRDLTPSNILVANDGTAKLIDFGIARPPVADSEAAPSAKKSLAGLSLTPGYAAPERVAGEAATTLSDIYSLGILLDRLLKDVADADLQAIIVQASAADPADRYPSVDALADDIVAWRDGEVVVARKGGKRYAFVKFFNRHRLGVAATTGALLLLLGALALAIGANIRAEAARGAEAKRFVQVRSLAHYLLFDLNTRLRRVAGNTGARADLADEAQNYLTLLAKGSGDREDLKLETAQGLIELGRIQGSPSEPNLGETDRAAANFLAAKKILGALPETPNAIKAPAQAQALTFHALILLHDEARQAQAAGQIASAWKTLTAVPAPTRTLAWHQSRRTVRKAQLELADVESTPEKVELLTAAIEADIAEWPRAMLDSDAADVDRAYVAYYRAQAESEGGKSKNFGLPRFLAAEKRFDALLAADPNNPVILYMSSWNLMDGFAAASRFGDENTSDRLIRRAAATIDSLISIDDRDQSVRKRAGSIKESLAQNLRDQERFGEAIALQRQVVALRRQTIGKDRRAKPVGDLAFSLMILGIIGRDAGDRKIACDSWTASTTIFEELEERQQLIGFFKGFVPGLRDKRKLCASGVQLSALKGPMR